MFNYMKTLGSQTAFPYTDVPWWMQLGRRRRVLCLAWSLSHAQRSLLPRWLSRLPHKGLAPSCSPTAAYSRGSPDPQIFRSPRKTPRLAASAFCFHLYINVTFIAHLGRQWPEASLCPFIEVHHHHGKTPAPCASKDSCTIRADMPPSSRRRVSERRTCHSGRFTRVPTMEVKVSKAPTSVVSASTIVGTRWKTGLGLTACMVRWRSVIPR